MALKLTGEPYSVVQGLDDLGNLKEVARSTSEAALTVRNDGSGPALKLVGALDMNNNSLSNGRLGTDLNANGKNITGVNSIQTSGGIAIYSYSDNDADVKDNGNTAYKGLRLARAYLDNLFSLSGGSITLQHGLNVNGKGLSNIGSMGFSDVTGSRLKTGTVAGAPSEADPDGAVAVDTTNHRLYVRSGGAWMYAALT